MLTIHTSRTNTTLHTPQTAGQYQQHQPLPTQTHQCLRQLSTPTPHSEAAGSLPDLRRESAP